MSYNLSKAEKIIQRYYNKDKFSARFVYLKSMQTLYRIKVIPRRKNGILFDTDIAVLDYTKSKSENMNLLELILQMYNCTIEDTAGTTKTFDLIDKFVPDFSTDVSINMCNNELQSISEGFIIYE